MKKIALVFVVVCVMFAVLGCPSTPPASGDGARSATGQNRIPGSFPQFVRDALRNQPEDALVGIGSSNLANFNQARTISTTRARAEISRQMNTMIQDMVRDYQAGSEADPSAALSFQENITVALSKSNLQGSTVVDQDIVDGVVWTVVQLKKADVVNEINQAQAAAKLAVPAMASFNAEARMNAAFANINSQPYQVNDSRD
jgi:hypothetical protein